MKGYIQVYTGNGKGKTTAALGLAVRAAGANLKVFFAQFLKSGEYSEIKALKRFEDLITIRQFGMGRFIENTLSEEDRKAAMEGLESVKSAVQSGQYDVVIIEEGNMATFFNAVPVSDLLEIMENKPDHVELVITGRYADQKVLDKADLVTEMKEIKHYYQKGVKARPGIEK